MISRHRQLIKIVDFVGDFWRQLVLLEENITQPSFRVNMFLKKYSDDMCGHALKWKMISMHSIVAAVHTPKPVEGLFPQ